MRLTPWVALLSVLVVVLAPQVGAQSRALVTSIADGDTLTVAGGTRVRLVQIDTPELGSGECYSRAARSALARLAPVGSTVRLEADPALDQVDRYDRALRYVRRGTMNVNIALVRAGAAAPYFYGGDRGQYADPHARGGEAGKGGEARALGRVSRDRARPVSGGRDEHALVRERERRPRDRRRPLRPVVHERVHPVASPGPRLQGHPREGVDPERVVGADPHRLDGDDDGWGCD